MREPPRMGLVGIPMPFCRSLLLVLLLPLAAQALDLAPLHYAIHIFAMLE